MGVIVELQVAESEEAAEAGAGRVTLRNETDAPVAFQQVQLESPSLAYEVVDDRGRPVPLPPPPVPRPDAEPVVVSPGGTWTTVHPTIVPDWTAPGHYRVRARVFLAGLPEAIHSDWSDLDV